MLLSAVATAAAACSGGSAHPGAAYQGGARRAAAGGRSTARTQPPSPAVSVLDGTTPDALTATFTRRLFSSAPVVVVAASGATALSAAERAATAVHAPLLLSGADGTPSARGAAAASNRAVPVSAPLIAEIKDLHPSAVLAVGLAPTGLAAQLPGVQVVSRTAGLPATGAPTPLHGVTVLVDRAAPDPALAAVTTTARVAGARVVAVDGDDPRADPAAIEALAAARPRDVLAIGQGFGPASQLASRVAAAVTGTQLPGGGQVVFPGHRLIALYGHPGDPGLGVLGQQDLPASIARAQRMAGLYRRLSRVPVVAAFEIIATVAQGSPGPDGSYSYESPVSSLRPWVQRATAAGMYVILDLQAGRANLLTQAKHYQSLLAEPDVGLALDPEWKLQPDQLPLRQIGSVSIGQVNSVVHWLAALTARDHLPQKVLVLHQFRLSMISGERDLDTSNDDLAIVVHMDGQGSQGDKQQTWDAVTGAAPPGVFFGWKNFFVEDHPMLGPAETMTKTPTPVMISYQ